jgi:ABC transporter DrrB family efflux protein
MITHPAPTSVGPAASAYRHPAGWLRFVSEATVYAKRRVAHIRQIPEKLLDVTLQPVMFVLLFAYVFAGAIAVEGGNYREYVMAGILIESLTFSMAGPAVSMATDLTEGVIDRFRVLPAARASYLAGHYVAELAGLLLSIVVLIVAGLVVGWRTHTSVVDVATGLVLLVVFTSLVIWIGTLIGMLVRSPDAVMGVVFVVLFPLVFLSGAFVPIESLPSNLIVVASWNPVSVVVTAIRVLFGNPVAPVADPGWPLLHPVLASFLLCVIGLVVVIPVTIRLFYARTAE